MTIKVSVIIPVYNVEKYVKKSVLSIVNQSLKEIEIITINDGSTDSSLDILNELAIQDKRIKVISQPNQGLSITRNIGISLAKGEYIYFFDSDDIIEHNTLELCYKKCVDFNLDFIFFDAVVFSDENIPLNFNYTRTYKYEDKVYIGHEILDKQMKDNVFFSSACLVFTKKGYLSSINHTFFPKILHEDELFTFLLYLKAKRVGLYNVPFFHRRLRTGSIMTSTYNSRSMEGLITVCEELCLEMKSYPQLTQIQRSLIKQRIHTLLDCILINIVRIPYKETKIFRQRIFYNLSQFISISYRIQLYIPILIKIKNKFISLIK